MVYLWYPYGIKNKKKVFENVTPARNLRCTYGIPMVLSLNVTNTEGSGNFFWPCLVFIIRLLLLQAGLCLGQLYILIICSSTAAHILFNEKFLVGKQ